MKFCALVSKFVSHIYRQTDIFQKYINDTQNIEKRVNFGKKYKKVLQKAV